MNKNVLVSAGVALSVVVLGLVFFGKTTVIERVVEKLGANPGNDLPGPIVKLNGAPIVALSQRFSTGTTSVCAFDVRPYASSTIISLGATVNGVPTTTTGTWKWYTALTPSSSTTELAAANVTATGTSIFATTTLSGSSVVIDKQDHYLVLDTEDNSTPYLDINGVTGSCSVLLHSPASQ